MDKKYNKTKLYYINKEEIRKINDDNSIIKIYYGYIIDENKVSYIVTPYYYNLDGIEEKILNDKQNLLKKCYKVNKKTLIAKISNCGITHRKYFFNIQDLKDYIYMDINKYRIIESLRAINDPDFFKELVERFNITNLKCNNFKIWNSKE